MDHRVDPGNKGSYPHPVVKRRNPISGISPIPFLYISSVIS